VTQIHNWCGLV